MTTKKANKLQKSLYQSCMQYKEHRLAIITVNKKYSI